MTKTDWTAEEVRATANDIVESISCVDPLFRARDMLTAFAERIAADESAVPVAWDFQVRTDPAYPGDSMRAAIWDVAEALRQSLRGGEVRSLFTHPPAQPAQMDGIKDWQRNCPDYPNCPNLCCPCEPKAETAQKQPGWKVPEGDVRLWDTQWMDIVNHDNCYRDWDKTDAINHAVKMTEQAIARNVADGKLPPAHNAASPAPPKEK